ncbi:sensor of ECF-type sigma factor [Flavobacterium sp. '19STA2R22 D10 B1']|uniref:sensor of ECF-type sigma factor n=1 Tax=Flavobacterium aerium TaxID=3037261 RepID=UPI00278C5D89|nr:sensor of ECF-type sigma factor [Flavobacterium sp. '19STA2R22 D10 B1']
MKFKTLFSLFLLLCALTSFAQDGQSKKEQIQALKSSFFTTELALTSNEAEKFWPIYNSYDDKQYELRHDKMHALIRKMKDGSVDKMSDKEALVFLSQIDNVEDELYQNRKKLVSDLKTVISPVKIIKLKKAEDDFNRKLLKQYRDKKDKK